MKVYKFKSFDNIDHIIDIIINKRLFCSSIEQLNDYREANVQQGKSLDTHKIIEFSESVFKEVLKYNVCSLTKCFNNHLLWAHYAGGYTGVAIEVEIDESEISPIKYDNKYLNFSDLMDNYSPQESAKIILSSKFRDWRYEKEVRIISVNNYYNLTQPISRIILGPRTTTNLTNALCLICSHLDINVERMVTTDKGISSSKFRIPEYSLKKA